MIYYLKGIVYRVFEDSIVLDVNNTGYQVLVSHPHDYSEGEQILLFTHQVIREDEEYLVGFSSEKEKAVFMSLIKVKGLGPKSAINALSATTPEQVMNAIASNNVAYLKKLPGIGAKAAAQIILDLKGELTGSKGDPTLYEDVYEALKSMGFKGAAIDRVLASINEPNATSEEVLKLALQQLGKK